MKIRLILLFLVLAIVLVFVTTCATTESEQAGTPESVEEEGEPEPAAPEESREKALAADVSVDKTGSRGVEASKEEGNLTFFTESEILGEESAARTGPGSDTSVASPRVTPSSSGLKAGFADDNRQYGYFVKFLEQYSQVPHFELKIQERITIEVKDVGGRAVANARVIVSDGENNLAVGLTTADGCYQFNPLEYGASTKEYQVTVEAMGLRIGGSLFRDGDRTVVIKLEKEREVPAPVPLDILFVLDTTGSMGDEIMRLRATIELIHLNLTNLNTNPEVRFGMVLYKDVGDEYNTQIVPLTGDLDVFRGALDLVEASGGGDTPENLQAALEESMKVIDWNPQGIRLGFIITDAPPHLDYGQEYTYAYAARDARAMGIKMFSVGTGGLDIGGEYVLRQISQYTGGKYIFLTYGEAGESEGGVAGSVSHHTGSNFQTDKLEAIIIRFAKEELSYLSDEPIDDVNPYFEATRIQSEEREETLNKLFTMALEQLRDYSTYAVGPDTTAAIMPIEPIQENLSLDAEYFGEQLAFSSSSSSIFTIVERQNLQKVIDELKLQFSGLTDKETVAEVGKLLNAEVFVTGKLYLTDSYELFLQLLRVESGEVLSITKSIIDSELGITVR